MEGEKLVIKEFKVAEVLNTSYIVLIVSYVAKGIKLSGIKPTSVLNKGNTDLLYLKAVDIIVDNYNSHPSIK